MSTISPQRVALIGLMGAGKSRVGRRVAEDLGWPFHDADKMIEAAAGKPIAAIFEDGDLIGARLLALF